MELAGSCRRAIGAPPGVIATRSCTLVSEPAGLFRFQESEALTSLITAAKSVGAAGGVRFPTSTVTGSESGPLTAPAAALTCRM